MSTFNGFVKEFPHIRIDHFRQYSDRPPPAACFLSHIHSDHLQGLETLKMPFVYCSLTTRRILLRMEKYPHRIDFAKGVLESRKQTYKHLKLALRALPLQTPTEIELNPTSTIRVTLFDANHCPGAVSFLIEDDSRAILYTGDVRAEPWWVNSLVQAPSILPYAYGFRKLDCVYLDTTFASHDAVYRKFQTKAEGLKELYQKLASFPADTTFYFRAWTLGYEHVWMTMSSLLVSQVHVDEYQAKLFAGTVDGGRDGFSMFEGPALAGYAVGNQDYPGCLTTSSDVRIHSCEPGSDCHKSLKGKNVVWITPIISRLDDGTELQEIGAGGGHGDLNQVFELDILDPTILHGLAAPYGELAMDLDSVKKLQDTVAIAQRSGNSRISLEGIGLEAEAEVTLKSFVEMVSGRSNIAKPDSNGGDAHMNAQDSIVHFPYSRHSSYEELRHLVSVFNPKDLCPCTVELASWTEQMSMESLFGDLCSENLFHHDKETRLLVEELSELRKATQKRRRSENTQENNRDTQTQSQEVSISAESDLPTGRPIRGPVERDRMPEVDSTITQRPLVDMASSPGSSDGIANPAQRNTNVENIRQEFHRLSRGSDLLSIDDESTASEEDEAADGDQTQESLATSIFQSQNTEEPREACPDQHHGSLKSASAKRPRISRTYSRRGAYMAAMKSLRDDNTGDWEDLNLRSIRRKGCGQQEVEL